METLTRLRPRLSPDWAIVAVLFVLLVGAVGGQMCFGLFVKPLADEFGWSRAAVSGAMSLLMAVAGVVGVVAGRATDRFGARAAIVPGIVVGTVCYLLISRIDGLWAFYLLFGVGGGILAGCVNTPSVSVVSRRFSVERRTLAIGVVLLGSIAGQMALSPSIAKVIVSLGWRSAWLIMAVVVFACGLPAMALLRRERGPAGGGAPAGEPHGEKAPGNEQGLPAKSAARTAAFWILMVSGVTVGLGFSAFSAHVVAYATDVGMSATAAALVLTVSSAGMAAGTLLAGAIRTKLSDRWALVGLTGLEGVATALLAVAGTRLTFYLLSIVLGFAFSAVVPVRMGVVGPLFGLRAVGTIIGILALSFSIGAIGGPFLAGYIFDVRGAYDLAFVLFGGLLVAGALSLCFLQVPSAAKVDDSAEPTLIWRAEDGLE